jgi:hypothetical protein
MGESEMNHHPSNGAPSTNGVFFTVDPKTLACNTVESFAFYSILFVVHRETPPQF